MSGVAESMQKKCNAIYQTVRKHLLTQRLRSMTKLPNGDKKCAYRGFNGTKCAVGCLITDHMYDPSMEGMGASRELVRHALRQIFNVHHGLDRDIEYFYMIVETLQSIHDEWPVHSWESRLDRFAVENGFTNS